MPSFPKLKLLGIGKSIVYDIDLNPNIKKSNFNTNISDIDINKVDKSEDFWNTHRYEALTYKDVQTYRIIDSLSRAINLEKKVKTLQCLINGEYPIGFINFDVNKTVNYNLYEGARLGIGAATNQKLSKLFAIKGYIGYGFKDKALKYGYGILFNVLKKHDFHLGFSYLNDIKETGSFDFNNKIIKILDYDFYRLFILNRFDNVESISSSIMFKCCKYANVNITAESYKNKPLYDYQFGTENGNVKLYTSEFNIDAISLSIRYAFKEKVIRAEDFCYYQTNSKWPIIWFKYISGLTRLFNGDYAFNKFLLRLDKSIYTKYVGRSSMRIDIGYVSGNVPLCLLFYTKASYRLFNLDISNSFSTARVNEFISDKFIAIFLKHNFDKLLFRKKNFSLTPVLITSFGWGDISNKKNHLNVVVKSMNKGLMESGILINSLLKAGVFCDIGLGAYYRYGAYKFSKFTDNISIRMSVIFPFLQ